jgi:hypothetical protein
MSQNTGIRPRSVLVPSKIALARIAMWIGGFQSSVLRGRQHPRQFSCHPRCGGLAAIVGRASMSNCLARARVR